MSTFSAGVKYLMSVDIIVISADKYMWIKRKRNDWKNILSSALNAKQMDTFVMPHFFLQSG